MDLTIHKYRLYCEKLNICLSDAMTYFSLPCYDYVAQSFVFLRNCIQNLLRYMKPTMLELLFEF